ncbi:MAG: PaaI family thioesterase [Bacteroidia bacterium]|nr:PaaI family thioesterase [Bacteroidia bacterium]
MEKIYFQDYMPGNVCFGCGADNPEGLQIKSYWEGEEAVCIWDSQEKYNGWKNLLNGGILATLVDCHSMGAAMAYAYKSEDRALDTMPEYRYATGTINVRYLKPTPNDKPIELRAQILEMKGRKTIVACQVFCESIQTAECEVVAIRVFDSSQAHGHKNNAFAG